MIEGDRVHCPACPPDTSLKIRKRTTGYRARYGTKESLARETILHHAARVHSEMGPRARSLLADRAVENGGEPIDD